MEAIYVYQHDISYIWKVHKISFYVGKQQWQALQRIAQSEGRKTSELARQAISDFIRSHRPLSKLGRREKKDG